MVSGSFPGLPILLRGAPGLGFAGQPPAWGRNLKRIGQGPGVPVIIVHLSPDFYYIILMLCVIGKSVILVPGLTCASPCPSGASCAWSGPIASSELRNARIAAAITASPAVEEARSRPGQAARSRCQKVSPLRKGRLGGVNPL
jgi:hypothetical protein